MAVKVSIIVATYNVEQWIRRCLDSLQAQTLKDFEVIMVDDGSTDNSGTICDEYAAKDNRFRVIHKANGGVSSARQCGIDNACGEYLIHADPDDWVEPDMLAHLYEKAKKDNADMVICDYYRDTPHSHEYCQERPVSLEHTVILYGLFQQLHPSCCNKLVRRVCYNKYRIRFPEVLSFGEDTFVNASLLQENIKVAYLPEAFVHYCYGFHESLCNLTDYPKHYRKQKTLMEQLKKTLHPQYQERCLINIEESLAMLALVTGGEEVSHFRASFQLLLRQYLRMPIPIMRKVYFFLAFHGCAPIVSIWLRIHQTIRKFVS